MSQKPLCDCNQGRLPCSPQRPVAQQQQDQNAARQRIAVLENAYIRAGEREHELRVKLHATKQKKAEMDALFGAYGDTLRPFLALMVRELKANSHKGDRDGWLGMTAATAFNEITHHHDKLGEALSALDYPQLSEYAADVANCCMMLLDVMGLLSASAEPINDLCAEGAHEFVPFHSTCVKCGEPYSAGPEPAEQRQGNAVVARVCGYTPGLGQVELKLPSALPSWLELGEVVTVLHGETQHQGKDAERYRWLRSRNLETISEGGVFAGITPDNLVLNEETLDEAIDAAMTKEDQP